MTEGFEMYQKVLVPLDGSELAECALPHVRNLLRCGYTAEVILLNVIEFPSLYIAKGYDLTTIQALISKSVKKYFADLESRFKEEGVKVKSVILAGNAPQSIIQYARENDIDLIVIATHGYTGMKQLMFGSVALKVLHDAHVPVLLIRPDSI